MQKIVKSIVKSALKAIGLYNVAARLLGNHAIRKLAQMNGLNIKHVGDSIRITNKNLQRSVIISSKHEPRNTYSYECHHGILRISSKKL